MPGFSMPGARGAYSALPTFDPLSLQLQQQKREQQEIEARIEQARAEKAEQDKALGIAPPVFNPFENPLIRLADFVRAAWDVLEPGVELIWNWHLDVICAHLEAAAEGLIRRLLINIPPGHMKSLLISVCWPAWMWLHRPEWRMLCASSGLELAIRDSGKCKDLVMSEWYQDTFQPDWKIRSDSKAKQFYSNTRTGMRKCVAVRAATTGFRGNAVLIDDPLQVMDALSDTKRDEANRWVSKAAASRLSNPMFGLIVMIMQRLHHDDPSAHVLKNKVIPYQHVSLPSYFEPEHAFKTVLVSYPKYAQWGTDQRQEAGELLFPQMFNQEALDEAEEQLQEDFVGQHQQRPTPLSGNMFKAEYFCLDPELKTFWPPAKLFGQRIIEALMCWDTAAKAGAKNDFCAGSVIARGEDGYVYLVPVVLNKHEVPDVEKQVLLKWAEWKVLLGDALQGAPIEEGASNATAVVQYSLRLMAHRRDREIEFEKWIGAGRNANEFDWKTPPGWTDLEWEMIVSAPLFHPLPFPPKPLQKVVRARGILSYCKGRNVRLVSMDDYITKMWLDQLLAFPFGLKDDAVDSTITGIERMAGLVSAKAAVDDNWMEKTVRKSA